MLFRCKFNTLRTGENGRHLADDTFKYIFLNEACYVIIQTHFVSHWSNLHLANFDPDNGLAPNDRLNNDGPDDWRMYALLGLTLQWRNKGRVASQITGV